MADEDHTRRWREERASRLAQPLIYAALDRATARVWERFDDTDWKSNPGSARRNNGRRPPN